MMPRNRPALLGGRLGVGQRFDISADGRQRRAQLVRDVRDEIAPDLIGAPEIRDVVEHEHGAVGAAAGRRRRARHDGARGVARRRELQRVGGPSRQRRGHQLRDRRVPDRFDVVAPERQVVEPQHPSRGLVGQLQPSLRIDDDDAFDHAGEDGFHARAIARLFGELPAD